MEKLVAPKFEFRVKTFSYNSRTSPFIAFDEPYTFLPDLSNIHHASFIPLILDIEGLLNGDIEKPIEFGGERTFCTAFKDKTLCEDSHEDTYIYVDTKLMLDLIKGFYEFKKPSFGGYANDKKDAE